MGSVIFTRLIGYIGSIILTLAAFFLISRPDYLGVGKTILVILSLAIAQFAIQFLFFLDLWREKGLRWNLIVFASTLSIILIIIIGGIWIMNHLNYNMMM